MEAPTYFITNDARMRDGVLDPVDKEVLKQAGGGKRAIIVTPEEFSDLSAKLPKGGFSPPAPHNPQLHKLTPEDMEVLGREGAAVVKHFQQEARRLLKADERKAAFVRRLRVDQRLTWRAIARACSTAWKTDWESNQLAGMAVCECAAEWFLEDYMKPPWN
jgi:hypothetical protein